MITLKEWLKYVIVLDRDDIVIASPIKCADGFTLSVQASRSHSCSPQKNHADSYTQVEVGYPSKIPELIMEYAESPKIPTKTVYHYVPIKLVEQLIGMHGGINGRANIRDK